MLPLTAEEQQRFDRTQWCPRCYETYVHGNETVRHHNHHTGKFIDALCNKCNLQIGEIIFIPVVFHNSKLYEAHHIFKSFNKRVAAKYDEEGRQTFESVNIIALNLQKYVSFAFQYLRFNNSCQFRTRVSINWLKICPEISCDTQENIYTTTICCTQKAYSCTNGSVLSTNSTTSNCHQKIRSAAT
jgi:hypothetical protein